MWRVTWQTGLAYLIFGPIYVGAHRALAKPEWGVPDMGMMAATGIIGWGLILSGGIFVLAALAEQLLRHYRRSSA